MVVCLTAHPSHGNKVLTSIVSEPIDWFWQRLEHLDETGRAMAELTGSMSPVAKVQRSLSSLLLLPFDQTALRTAARHFSFEKPDVDMRSFASMVRAMVMNMISQMEWRFGAVYGSWPFRLARLADMSLPYNERLREAQDLFDAHPCCVDAPCGQKVLAMASSPEALLDDRHIISALSGWRKHGKLCNMHTERDFARIRRNAPRQSPNAERLCSNGTLALLRHRHASVGGQHIDRASRCELLQAGVPIAASHDTPRLMPQRSRGHVAFMSSRVRAAFAAQGRLSKEEQAEIRRKACADYTNLAPDEKRAWADQARLQAQATQQVDAEQSAPRPVFDGARLFGLCEASAPLRRLVVEEVIKRRLHMDEASSGALSTMQDAGQA